jgi:hypothetical protein
MQQTIGQAADGIVNLLQQVCCATDEQWQSLKHELMLVFVTHNKESMTQRELTDCKAELEKIVNQFKEKHQRIFVYVDPFDF